MEIFDPYMPGLQDLGGFSHLILLYHFHRVGPANLLVTPFMDTKKRGVFATRAPARPNPFGLSIVRLTGIEDRRLYIMDVDILDETPLLDVKPYVRIFDHVQNPRDGWLRSSTAALRTKRSDDRFGSPDAGSG